MRTEVGPTDPLAFTSTYKLLEGLETSRVQEPNNDLTSVVDQQRMRINQRKIKKKKEENINK